MKRQEKPIIFRQQGTHCIVICIESADLYIPGTIITLPNVQGESYQFTNDAPLFRTQGEAWAYHVHSVEQLKSIQLQQVDQHFDTMLAALKTRAGRSLALVPSEEGDDAAGDSAG